jgi:hypothetical protein
MGRPPHRQRVPDSNSYAPANMPGFKPAHARSARESSIASLQEVTSEWYLRSGKDPNSPFWPVSVHSGSGFFRESTGWRASAGSMWEGAITSAASRCCRPGLGFSNDTMSSPTASDWRDRCAADREARVINNRQRRSRLIMDGISIRGPRSSLRGQNRATRHPKLNPFVLPVQNHDRTFLSTSFTSFFFLTRD